MLAAGAAGAWVGTALLACPEAINSPSARARALAASETDTLYTSVFDVAQGIGWPPGYPGRALANEFWRRWSGREDELVTNPAAAEQLAAARRSGNYDVAFIYAGQGVGLLREERPPRLSWPAWLPRPKPTWPGGRSPDNGRSPRAPAWSARGFQRLSAGIWEARARDEDRHEEENMARSIWSGVLSFGLVSVPVELYSATEAHEPAFHQFQKGTSDRIRYQRVNERTGEEVDYSDIAKGADVGDGNVLLDQDELDAVAPGRSRAMDIRKFVDLDDIDPLYFNKACFVGPQGEENAKTYALLRDAMARSNRAAIASFVMRSKEYLAAVRADGDLLVLETLFFADEVRDPHEEIDNLPGRVRVSQAELRMAGQLIEAMSGPWRPSEYRDTYTDRVNQLIDAKAHDKVVQPSDETPAATNVAGLTEALRASLDAARQPRRGARPATARKTGARTAPGGRTKNPRKRGAA